MRNMCRWAITRRWEEEEEEGNTKQRHGRWLKAGTQVEPACSVGPFGNLVHLVRYHAEDLKRDSFWVLTVKD